MHWRYYSLVLSHQLDGDESAYLVQLGCQYQPFNADVKFIFIDCSTLIITNNITSLHKNDDKYYHNSINLYLLIGQWDFIIYIFCQWYHLDLAVDIDVRFPNFSVSAVCHQSIYLATFLLPLPARCGVVSHPSVCVLAPWYCWCPSVCCWQTPHLADWPPLTSGGVCREKEGVRGLGVERGPECVLYEFG